MTISNTYSNNQQNTDLSQIRSTLGITNFGDQTLNSLSNEQFALADNIQVNTSISDAQAETMMENKIIEQENSVMNSNSLNYEEKEYILTNLEVQRQSKDTYLAQYG
ncbi:MAG: hypothetical protein EAZ35_06200 [Sphingobacteriia bacterium]|nr:MAG: hypothetical protein EAZ41_08430 [Sphingobacteriia bacterium]TAG30787.1 MAG: hypothetical protein EAZ35_06200 [Sphingobacteriia bacterium]